MILLVRMIQPCMVRIINVDEQQICRFKELHETMSGSYFLFYEFVRKDLNGIEDYYYYREVTKAIKAIISLFLSSASRVRYFIDDTNDQQNVHNQLITASIEGIYTEISFVFNKLCGSSFGQCGDKFMEYYSSIELKVQMFFIGSYY